MKRDMDLARDILLKVEEGFVGMTDTLQIEGYEQGVVHYHLRLLHEAGLLTSPDSAHYIGEEYRFYDSPRLTWNGHDWIDAARDDKKWGQAMETIAQRSGSFTFEIVKEVLSGLIRGSLGLP